MNLRSARAALVSGFELLWGIHEVTHSASAPICRQNRLGLSDIDNHREPHVWSLTH
jgi:hypothetical protein